MPSPEKLAHVVLKTGQLPSMLDWYCDVLEGRVTYSNGILAFMTYDDEHHRVAFMATGSDVRPTAGHTGLHHVAFTYGKLDDLLATYTRLRDKGTLPFWCVNHGPTTSFYFEDPDGNQVELQIDNFPSDEELQQWFDSGAFERNPIGNTFDPEELLARFESGEPISELVKQQ